MRNRVALSVTIALVTLSFGSTIFTIFPLFSAKDGRYVPITVKTDNKKSSIVVLSSFVTVTGDDATNQQQAPPPISSLIDNMRDHIINKACYAHVWNYPFIVNTTYGFTTVASLVATRPWLRFGGWHRVPQLEAALVDRTKPNGWVLYADLDYVIKDISRPLESFTSQFELYGLEPHVFVATDTQDVYAFSDFAFMIRNSDFGRSVLRYWQEFAMGICPRGNFLPKENDDTLLQWYDTDQPGLWYALIKAHMEFYPNDVLPRTHPRCNASSGYIAEENGSYWLSINEYFAGNGLIFGNSEEDLASIPKYQPIIWSRNTNASRPGLGLQMNWGPWADAEPFAFGIHQKQTDQWPAAMIRELDLCKRLHRCDVHIDNNTNWQVITSCNSTIQNSRPTIVQ